MPFKLITAQDKPPAGSRILISGPPITLKTTATLTFPKPNYHFSLPGEKGWETVPTDVEGIFPYIWQFDEAAQYSPHAVVRDVESQIFKVIADGIAKHGTWQDGARWTITLDGLHKLYHVHRLMHLADLRASKVYLKAQEQGDDPEEKITGPSYGRSHDSFGLFMTKVLQRPVPYIVATVWEGKSKDDPDDTRLKAPSHIFPDLPGEMAKRIVGEFGITVYSEVTPPDPQGRLKGYWIVKPQGKIWGVGAHVDPRIALGIPPKVAANFNALEPYLKPKGSTTVTATPTTEEKTNG